jgi:hypothetical protein
MAGKPFVVNSSGAPRGGTVDGEKASPWPGKAVTQAQRSGGPLPTPAQIADADRHGHSPLIPWPKEQESQGPKPFKLGK